MKVERLRQARRWDSIKATYVRAGICHPCAAQAAYGHVDGFCSVREPCQACRPIVSSFPTAVGSGWRKVPHPVRG